tara:strand:+ start:954 stop:1178 length:225 start_codon:yes stop_codon:yes gene_type:complete
VIKVKIIFYRVESAFSLVHIFCNFALSLSNKIGRPTKIANAITANESVVNLAIPHSDEAKAIIDRCIEIPDYNK